ncbi:toll/interleukin-1 receptor domain-containing protein [Archangium violaceum]|uniref:toll/interleukin-1 receptor domain-containing protein n=1 Tax=Archangium violaceum TaxID=83451 RepID=UPI002B311F56|nr:toll/interleukin-1 receptor domain-containing protein [Archangium gephyra]
MTGAAAATRTEFRYDVFISYSRKDTDFARRLEQTLRTYRPPPGLAVPQRHLRVFRDESDFTGSEYHASLARELGDSAKLLVICSPHSAASPYVADEIRRFSEHRGKEHIIPVLLDGIPNNEAGPEDVHRKAFPEQLVQLLPIPLAADYRGFDARAGGLHKGRFSFAWFKTLADVYADYGVDRGLVEQRERRRQARRLRLIALTSSVISLALLALAVWALFERGAARRERDRALAGETAARARLAFDGSGEGLVSAVLQSIASLRGAWTLEGQVTMVRVLGLLPLPPVWRHAGQPAPGSDDIVGRYSVLAFSPDGSYIASIGAGPVRLLAPNSGDTIATIEDAQSFGRRTMLAFSPDGRLLVAGCGPQVCVIDPIERRLITRVSDEESQQDGMVWSASFSLDGQHLATASYHSDVVIYDVGTWRVEKRLPTTQSVFTVAFSPTDPLLITGDSSSAGLRVWRVGSYERALTEVGLQAKTVSFGPKGGGFVSAGMTLQVWQLLTGTEGGVSLKQGAERPIQASGVLARPDRNCLVAPANNGVHVLCGTELEERLLIPVSSSAIAVSPDGRRLVNEQTDGVVASWPLTFGADRVRLELGSSVTAMAGPEQGWLAVGTVDGSVVILDTQGWRERIRLRMPAPVRSATISGDGRQLVIGAGAAVHLFDTATWRQTASTGVDEDVIAVAFARDSSLLVVTKRAVAQLDPADGRERFRAHYEGEIESLRASQDGTRIAVAARGSTRGHNWGPVWTRIWDLTRHAELAWRYDDPSGQGLNPPAGGSLENGTRVWGDSAILAQVESWPALPLEEPGTLSSGNGTWVAGRSASTLNLRYASEQRLVAEFQHEGEVTGMRFIPAAAPRWLVSADTTGMVRVWPVDPHELIAEACARLRGLFPVDSINKRLAQYGAAGSCDETPARR